MAVIPERGGGYDILFTHHARKRASVCRTDGREVTRCASQLQQQPLRLGGWPWVRRGASMSLDACGCCR